MIPKMIKIFNTIIELLEDVQLDYGGNIYFENFGNEWFEIRDRILKEWKEDHE